MRVRGRGHPRLGAGRGEVGEQQRQVAGRGRRRGARAAPAGGRVGEVHDLRGPAAERAVAEAEVQRCARDDHEVRVAERGAPGAGDEQLVPGGQDAAGLPVGDHRQPQLLGERAGGVSAPSIHTSEPSTRTGRRAAFSSAATRASRSGSAGRSGGSGISPGRAGPAGPNRWSMWTSRKTGPRCGAAAVANARATSAASVSGPPAVSAIFVTGASSGGWSSSWSAPWPHRPSGARPPSTTTGDPLKWAVVMPLTPFVTPGPAVRTAKPGRRVSRAVASAANTAVCSCRTSRTRGSAAVPGTVPPALPPAGSSPTAPS